MLEVQTQSSGIPELTPSLKKPLSKSSEITIQIRDHLLREYSQNPELYDEEDIHRLKTNEWFVKRFVIAATRDPESAFQSLNTTLQWKKKVQINTTPMNAFPGEFYKIGGLFAYEPDKDGHPVVYMRIRMHRKIPELSEPIQQFLFHTINRIDRDVDGQGIVAVFDCSDAGYQNMDIDLLKALIDVSFKYFPFAVKKVIVYELSWMLSAFRRLAMTFIPNSFKRIIVFCDKNSIHEHISIENLPDFMGGTCQKDYRQIPSGCPSVDKLAQERGFTTDDVSRIMAIFEPFLKESEKEIEKRSQIHKENKTEQEIESSSDSGISGAEENSNDDAPLALVASQAIDSGAQREEFISIFPQNIINFKTIQTNIDKSNSMNSFEVATSAVLSSSAICGTILVRNTRNVAIAFKVQTTQAKEFTVSPSAGIIMTGAWIRIVIRGRKMPESFNEDGIFNSKFLLLFCTTSDDAEKHVQSRRTFDVLFTDAAAQNRLVAYRLQSKICDSDLYSSSITADDCLSNVTHTKTAVTPYKDKQKQLLTLERQFTLLARSQRRMKFALVTLFILFLILLLFLVAALIFDEFFKFFSLKPNSVKIDL